MKTHAIIPVFIPHRGCPNDCVFCNQKAITARTADVSPEDVKNLIETYLPTLQNRNLETIEIAFFGGSFTGIPIEEQSAFLEVASEYKKKGLIHKIHMSTRPDYINEDILDNLKKYDADVIELGVQSFDPEVLAASNRGHTAEDVEKACRLIKNYGFELGIQLMIGLPQDSPAKCIYSAREAVRMGPSIARLYPTIVLNDTELYHMYRSGKYRPLTSDDAVEITKEMYKILDDAGINIIRVGLKSTDLITEGGEIQGNTFHPAFRQLVEGQIAREQLETQLTELLETAGEILADGSSSQTADEKTALCTDRFTFCSSSNSFSNMIGNARRNKLYFAEKYPELKIRYKVDTDLEDGCYTVVKW